MLHLVLLRHCRPATKCRIAGPVIMEVCCQSLASSSSPGHGRNGCRLRSNWDESLSPSAAAATALHRGQAPGCPHPHRLGLPRCAGCSSCRLAPQRRKIWVLRVRLTAVVGPVLLHLCSAGVRVQAARSVGSGAGGAPAMGVGGSQLVGPHHFFQRAFICQQRRVQLRLDGRTVHARPNEHNLLAAAQVFPGVERKDQYAGSRSNGQTGASWPGREAGGGRAATAPLSCARPQGQAPRGRRRARQASPVSILPHQVKVLQHDAPLRGVCRPVAVGHGRPPARQGAQG